MEYLLLFVILGILAVVGIIGARLAKPSSHFYPKELAVLDRIQRELIRSSSIPSVRAQDSESVGCSSNATERCPEELHESFMLISPNHSLEPMPVYALVANSRLPFRHGSAPDR